MFIKCRGVPFNCMLLEYRIPDRKLTVDNLLLLHAAIPVTEVCPSVNTSLTNVVTFLVPFITRRFQCLYSWSNKVIYTKLHEQMIFKLKNNHKIAVRVLVFSNGPNLICNTSMDLFRGGCIFAIHV